MRHLTKVDEAGRYEVGDELEFTLTNGRTIRAIAAQQDGPDMIFATEAAVMNCAWNKSGRTKGGYAESDIRKTVNGEVLKLFPDELRAMLKPFHGEENNGDLLTIPSMEEIFDEGKMLEGMKDRRNVIIMDEDDQYTDWYWLRSVYSATGAARVAGNGDAGGWNASYVFAVRPLFRIENP